MNRREALSATALLLGGTIIGAGAFVSCRKQSKEKDFTFDPEDIDFLDEVADVIIPTTPDSPGARQATIGAFMKTMITDCYDEADQKIFSDGIQIFRGRCRKELGEDFQKLGQSQKHTFLVTQDREANAYEETKTDDQPSHYFTMIKQLTVLGYFSSAVGATQALRYVPVPGRYDGCVPYQKGEKAWAT